jgi:hypothetical protein
MIRAEVPEIARGSIAVRARPRQRIQRVHVVVVLRERVGARREIRVHRALGERAPVRAQRQRRAAGGQQIVDQKDLLARPHRVGLDLDGVAAVLQVVGVGQGGARQLALLAHHDEALVEPQRQRRGDQEAAGFDAGEDVRLVLVDDLGKALDRGLPGLRVRQQRRDVVEQDARRRKIRNPADVLLQVHRPSGPPGDALFRPGASYWPVGTRTMRRRKGAGTP